MLKLTHKNCLTPGPFWIPRKNIFFCLLQLLCGGSKLQASGFQKEPFATAKQHLIACRNRAQTYPQKLPNAPSEFLEQISLFYFICFLQLLSGGSKLQASGFQNGPFATAKQHLIACRNRAQTYPQKLPNVPSEFLEKMSVFFCLLQLLFGGCKLQASALQNGPFATAKQHLIACRNRAQTYPQKLPNAPSEFLEKMSTFSVSCSSCLVAASCMQASALQNEPFATAKQHLIACRNRAQTYPQKLPNAPSEFLEKIYLFLFFCFLQLLSGSSKLQSSALQNEPFATAKQHLIACRNRAQTYPQKLPNAPSEFLEKISFSVSCSCCLVASGCKQQASRTDPSPHQNSI